MSAWPDRSDGRWSYGPGMVDATKSPGSDDPCWAVEPPPAAAGKDVWRRWARDERAGGRRDSAGNCRALARFLTSALVEPGWVVAYRALADEVVLDLLFDELGTGLFALTRTPDDGYELTVHPLTAPAERHRYGFWQPVAGGQRVADGDIAAVLVPGLAFDRSGGRLGRGMGYYDRFLARLDPTVVRIGVTGGVVVPRLPVDAHDVAMTHLVDAEGVVVVAGPDGGQDRLR